MPLIKIFESSADTVLNMSLEQIVRMAGDGNLKDGSESSREIRTFFSRVKTQHLESYAYQCLESSFSGSGFVLQDLANELGRRLEYDVTNGRYRGSRGNIGHDGLWADTNNHSLIVEVKTTDTYRINLDTIASYRSQLIKNTDIARESSILIIVGRQDTGDLEAQIRGSRHAWNIRIISMDALIKLVKIKETTDEQNTLSKIKSLLVPFEYTRVDNLIEVLFTAAKDVEGSVEEGLPEQDEEGSCKPSKGKKIKTTERAIIEDIRSKIINDFSRRANVSLINKSKALFWSPDKESRVACTISKHYPSSTSADYWYAYHPKWDLFLANGKFQHLLLGCVDKNNYFSIPRDFINKNSQKMPKTCNDDGEPRYWHISIKFVGDTPFFKFLQGNQDIDISDYMIDIAS